MDSTWDVALWVLNQLIEPALPVIWSAAIEYSSHVCLSHLFTFGSTSPAASIAFFMTCLSSMVCCVSSGKQVCCCHLQREQSACIFCKYCTLVDDVEVPSFLDTKLLLEADTRLSLSDMPGLKLLLLTRECKCMALVQQLHCNMKLLYHVNVYITIIAGDMTWHTPMNITVLGFRSRELKNDLVLAISSLFLFGQLLKKLAVVSQNTS